MVHLKITPDSRLDNDAVEQLAQTLCMYQAPIQRWHGKGFNRKHFVSFESVIQKGSTFYFLTVLEEMEEVAKKAIQTAWPKASIEKIADPLRTQPCLISELDLKYHYFLALKVDRREITHVQSILEVLSLMDEKDQVVIQTLASPAPTDWYQSAVDAYEQFKKGELPSKIRLDKEGLKRTGLKAVGSVVFGAIGIVQELATGNEPEKINLNEGERAVILRDGHLTSATLGKVKADAYDTCIRVGVICAEPKRAQALMRSVTMAFRELDGDNHLIAHNVNVDKLWKKMQDRSMGMRIQSDYLSIPEVSRLLMLPTGPLQERFHIPNIKQLEVEIPEKIVSGGLYLGDHELKGKKTPVYQPTDNDDITCLPNVVIGPMGCGKTKGYGANWIVQAVKNGFGGMVIDPAKGEVGDEIEASLPKDKVVRLNLSKTILSLDFCEANYSAKAKTRLSNMITSFFNTADETMGQTTRFLKAAVMSARTTKISEFVRILEDDDYRAEVIKEMPDGFNKTTLLSMDPKVMSEKRKAQILAPIYNRMEVIMSDEHLFECFESEESLDMVELMSQRKAIIIDVLRKDGMDPTQIDVIINLLSLKIDLAMGLRSEENQFPFLIVFDEPHQFLRSAKTWKAAAVESRKWRVGYTWMFHSWEQIPKDLAEIIKSAGPHYHIYSGASKKTWKEIGEEIAPYKLEDALKLPQYHAINVLRNKEGYIPFIAKMAKPPSEKG